MALAAHRVTLIAMIWLLAALLAACDEPRRERAAVTATPPLAGTVEPGATPAPSPGQPALSIAAARALPLNTAVHIEGVVAASADTFDTRGRRFYVQDRSGGIAVFYAGGGLQASEGQAVTVRGALSAYNSELQVVLSSADAVRVTGVTVPPVPQPVNTGQITTADYGRLVTVRAGVIVRQGTGIWIDDGSGGVQALVIPAGITPLPEPGDAVTVTGVTSRSKGTLQILPRHRLDLEITGRWHDPERPPPPLPRALSPHAVAGVVKLAAVYPHTYESRLDELGEAVCIQNTGSVTVDISGWRLTDNALQAVLPNGVTLPPGKRLWVARDVQRFSLEFGQAPDLVMTLPLHTAGAEPPAAAGAGSLSVQGSLRLSNFGGEVALLDPEGALVDAFAYGLGGGGLPGWRGRAVQPYLFDTFVPPAGQVYQRKLDQRSGLPLPDTDSAADWLQDPDDVEHGRRLLYAGWSLEPFFFPAAGTEQATTQLLLGPDHLYEAVAALIDSARESIDLEVYTFSNPYLLDRLLARQRAGVRVRALFDGGVFNAPDGSYEEDRWVAQQIVRAGGQAWFWTDAPAQRLPARFNNHHQKFLIVDNHRVLITSENFEQSSMPAGSKTNGATGNRGTGVITDAPGVVARLAAVFTWDADPRRPDIQPVALDRQYRAPVRRGDQSGDAVQRPAPLTLAGPLTYEVVQAPESSLRSGDSLIGMVRRAGAGDSVLVQQQYEHLTWSGGTPNPRLQAYIEAARRGARLLLLLDAVNDAGQNQRTLDFLHDLARREELAIEGRLGRPAGGPIHNKMVLVTGGVDGWVHISSINGSENSSVFNREMGIQIGSIEAYRYFAQAFAADWRVAGGRLAVDTRSPPAPAATLSPLVTRGPLRLSAACACRYAIDGDPASGGREFSGEAEIDGSGLTEDRHILYLQQRDAAGAWGPLTALPFTIARTPPSLEIGFDPNHRRITLTAGGPHSATAAVTPPVAETGRRWYTLQDAAGNELQVELEVTASAGRVTVRVVTVGAGEGTPRTAVTAALAVEFAGAEALTALTSRAVTATGEARSAYDAATNRTALPGGTRPGPRTLELQVDQQGARVAAGR